MPLNRRELLEKCMALGVVTTASALLPWELAEAWAQAERASKRATPAADLGPFYLPNSPRRNALRAPGDAGLPLLVSGQVFSVNGELLPEALVEVWQTDHAGVYDVKGNRYRAMMSADAKATYDFSSVMPGHYPDRVCQHVHYRVSAPGHKVLVTQLYFATDPVLDGDPDKNYSRDPLITSRELVRPVRLVGEPKELQAAVQFDLVLERA